MTQDILIIVSIIVGCIALVIIVYLFANPQRAKGIVQVLGSCRAC